MRAKHIICIRLTRISSSWTKNEIMKPSTIILIVGMVILAVGAALSVAKIEPWADYVLIAGAVVVIARGFVRNHEKDDQN